MKDDFIYSGLIIFVGELEISWTGYDKPDDASFEPDEGDSIWLRLTELLLAVSLLTPEAISLSGLSAARPPSIKSSSRLKLY